MDGLHIVSMNPGGYSLFAREYGFISEMRSEPQIRANHLRVDPEYPFAAAPQPCTSQRFHHSPLFFSEKSVPAVVRTSAQPGRISIPSNQPLIAPTSVPLAKYFCAKGYMHRIGTVVMMTADIFRESVVTAR